MVRTDAPTGTVTFLFTDIEGSTRMWDQHPSDMSDALSTHDDLLQAAIDTNAGYVFSKAGDGWGVAFESPLSALDTALNIQDDVGSQSWPGDIDEISIRMGLHTGTSAERNGDYFGTAVNRAARVAGVADGGQVFVTDAVHTLVADETREEWMFRDLGEHRLRDLTRAERIWQLDRSDSSAPAATLAPRAAVGNIPRLRATVIGREAEIAAVTESVGGAPLVTLVGVGGVGKTTIAKTVGIALSDSFAAGAWFVDLTATGDAGLIAAAVATSLDIAERADMTPKESLFDALRAEPRLVILDNAEHQIDAVADLVDETLAAVPDVKLIVTSREPLRLRGEDVHRIGPLGIDNGGGTAPAVELFVERARTVAPDLADDAFATETVGAICRKLDGLPLAIELAASQSETMTPSELLSALERGNLDLHSSSRSTVQRHQSLDDLVGWSYDLLDPLDQTVFQRLSAFTGGCTMDAALTVCAGGDVSESDVRGAVATLVRKSIVQTQRSDESTRLTMLETLRSFSAARLAARADKEETAERHADWFAKLARTALEGVAHAAEAEVLVAILADLDNIQAATRWASAHGRFDLMNDLGSGIPFLMESKMRPGLADWAKEMAATVPPEHPAQFQFAMATAASMIFRGRFAEAPDVFRSETAGLEQNPRVEAIQRYVDHVAGFFGGDLSFVVEDGEGAMDQLFEHGFVREASGVGADYALALFYTGDAEQALRVADRIGEVAERTANPTLLAWSGYVHAEIIGASDPASAIEILEESVESSITVDNEFVAGISLIALSSIAGRNGDMDTALDGMYRAIRLWRARGNRPQMWTAVRNLVEILHTVGNDGDALTLNAAVEADAEHAPELFGPFGDHYQTILAEVEDALDPGEVADARRVGGALDYPGTANFALAAIGRATA